MACADEKGRFTLSWDIGNFSDFLFSAERGNSVLTSPAWKTEITDESALSWFLSIYQSESNIRIDLNCLNESGIPDNCEVSFISSCGRWTKSATVSSPNVTMMITDRVGSDITAAQVGDALALRFEIIDSNS
ncbi:hypothetical protein JTE90_024815 [Oedothorax gibbosus]|uniref:Uncharacterized protein n=1 Tax=Oedothorax gibbosus TaxID=931172 RepID=A0AAV6UNM6_9ARAC|nr:hypothetical protein JTE90_024815 [Oedothorax gibbosus]